MKDELKEFLAEGIKRYKEALYVLREFEKKVESELRGILMKRKDWGAVFKPKKPIKIKFVPYGKDQAIIVAQANGSVRGKPATFRISIDWWRSKSDYPFYEIWLLVGPASAWDKVYGYKKKGRIEPSGEHAGLKMYHDPNDFDLEKDINLLVNEFLRIL